MKHILYVVIPCYNEQEVLLETAARIKTKMHDLMEQRKIASDSRVVFINDGSTDETWTLIKELHFSNPLYSGINLSLNKGHQNALLAGLMKAKKYADMVISMDADLQDDLDAMDAMIEKYYGGADIVYGVRNSRAKDRLFKKVTAEGFYRLMNHMGANTLFNHADYRLMSRRAIDGLAEFREVNLFLRGIIPMIGYTTEVVYYERGERFAGKSKYPLGKMIAFAIEGITSLSIRPIRMITILGILIFLISFVIMIYSVVRYFEGETIVGWPTLMVSIWAIGGLILLSLGVVGEYIGKIYLETKARPRYLIKDFLHEKKGKVKKTQNNDNGQNVPDDDKSAQENLHTQENSRKNP